MKYMGSKARLSKDLAPIINKIIQDNKINIYIEPFVGGSNMMEHIICKYRIGADINEYLIAMRKDLQIRNILKQAKELNDVGFICRDYTYFNDFKDVAIYCAPPYQDTSQHGANKDFDHQRFWDWVRKMSENNIVFVSEYNAPDDFVEIYKKTLTTTLDKNSRKKDTEKLFIHKSLKHKTANFTHY